MMKARNENGTIKRYLQMPKYWAHYAGNFDEQSDEVHKQFGFYPVVFTEYDAKTQIRDSILIWDEVNSVFTYTITDKSAEQIQAEYESYIEELDSEFDNNAVKNILKRIMLPIMADEENLTEQDIEDAKMLYPYYRIGKAYDPQSDNIEDKVFRYEGLLYKVIKSHTSQEDWKPNIEDSLYIRFTPAGIIEEWVEPTGAHDAYAVGVKVTWNGKTWINTYPDNVYEPGVYGWDEI